LPTRIRARRPGDYSGEKTSTLRGDCLAGGYTAGVILCNRPDTIAYHTSRRATSMKGSRRRWCSAARATSSARVPAGRASGLSARASSTGAVLPGR